MRLWVRQLRQVILVPKKFRSDMLKLHKRECCINVVHRDDTHDYAVYLLGKDFSAMSVPPWELVALWYKIGALIGFDYEDAKAELELLHWKHTQGELDEPSQRIIGRKNRNKKKLKYKH